MTRTTPSSRPFRRPTDFDRDAAIRHLDLEIRVRYVECDPMGVVHHSVYPVWFEMGRTEMLRASGGSYRAMEAAGAYLVVADLSIRFRMPARYDDVLRLRTHLLESGRARIRHGYELVRADAPDSLVSVAVATSTIACVDRDGRLQPIPEAAFATLAP